MSETKKSDGKEVKKNTEKSENSKTISENKPKGTNLNPGDSSKKNDAPKSASQTSISHFSSVSTPEYRYGWNKIFGKPDTEKSMKIQKSDYEKRKELVAVNWRMYQETKDEEHLAIICRELPFFGHPEVGQEIARLLKK